MTLPLTPEELKQYNNVPTTPLSQKLGDTINELVAGTAYQVEDMAARNALTPSDKEVVRVKSTGELFVYDATYSRWRVVPNSSTRPDYFTYIRTPFTPLYLYVDATSSDDTGEGTQANPFASVARALNAVPHGYKRTIYIMVASGTYDDVEWVLPNTGAIMQSDSTGDLTFANTSIRIIGQAPYTDGEQITITAGNTTANAVPHPSGLGNYACLSDFSFPTFSTPINPADPTGQYMLFAPPTSAGTPSVNGSIIYSADNTTGAVRLVNQNNANIFSTGTFYILRRDQLPSFTRLSRINNYNNSPIRIQAYNLAFVTTSGSSPTGVAASNVSFQQCYFHAGLTLNTNSESDCSFTSCILDRLPGYPVTPYFWWKNATRGIMQKSYVKDTVLNASTGQFVNFGGVFESTGTSYTKIVTGSDDVSTSHGAGPSLGISYFGALDFIGPGAGMQLTNTSVRLSAGSGNLTFDGVSNPMILASGSFFGVASGTAIGTGTSFTIVGVHCATGSTNTLTPSAAGIAGWNVQNTATPGAEIQVGANPAPVTFASLPQTDFALGNTSVGAVAK